MRHILLILCLLTIPTLTFAQEKVVNFDVDGVLIKKYEDLPKGDSVKLLQIKSSEGIAGQALIYLKSGESLCVPLDIFHKIFTFTPKDNEAFWKWACLSQGVYKYYGYKGYHHTIRQQAIEDANQYIYELRGSSCKDEYLKDYVRGFLMEIVPRMLDNNRYEKPDMEIFNSPNPDIRILSNGTLLMSTGLLSLIDSENELKALIADEIAHYALDHHVITLAKEQNRVSRAETWGVVLGVAAIAAEIAISRRDECYFPGGVMNATYVIGNVLTETAREKMGLGYTDKQFFAADEVAEKYLEFKGLEVEALSSALSKISQYYNEIQDNYALSRRGGYAYLEQRIEKLPKAAVSTDKSFMRKMSRLTTFNALIELDNRHYAAVAQLMEKKIENGIANDEDYLILVKANMNRSNDPGDNRHNLALIRHAKQLTSSHNLGLYKQEILLLMRMNVSDQATEALQSYAGLLTDFRSSSTNSDDIKWANEELMWSEDLLDQVRY